MSLPIYQRVAVTDAGDVIPGAEYTVINENTGVAAPIYSDRTGATLLTAPYFADSAGTIQFFIAQGTTFRVAASGGVGTYTDRYVYGVAGAVLTDASGSVDDGGSDPLTISRDGGTDSNVSIRFKQLSTSWYAGVNSSNNFGFDIDPNLINAPVQITPVGYVGINTSSPAAKLHTASGVARTSTAKTETAFFSSTDGDDFRFGLAVSHKGGATDADRYASLDSTAYRISTDTFAAGGSLVLQELGGNCGIGTNSPLQALHVNSGTSNSAAIFESTDSTSQIWLKDSASSSTYQTGIACLGNNLLFNNGGERLRINSAGNLLVGTTTAPPFGNVNFGGSFYADAAIGDESSGIYFGLSGVYPSVGGVLSDNQIDLGNAAYRWDDVYATNGTIQTSDRNEKQDILEITAAETAVATACKGLLRSFRWKDSVAEKGDDARIHFGIIAQDLQDAFTAEGLDAGRYAMFISGTSWETQTEVAAVEAVEGVEFVQAVEASEALYSEDGELVSEAVEAVEAVEGVEAVEAKEAYTRTDTFQTLAEAPAGATERTRLGVRYSELLAFIIAAI